MSAEAEVQFESDTGVVLFGLDDGGRAHASAFDANTAEAAEKAAGLMGMRLLRLETEEQRALAAKLPRGRVFESGRAFVPFVKRPIFESLAAFGGVQVGDQPGGAETACTGSSDAAGAMPGGEGEAGDPANAEFGVGTVVLATTGLIDGWWEAVILKMDEKGVMTLKWRYYTSYWRT